LKGQKRRVVREVEMKKDWKGEKEKEKEGEMQVEQCQRKSQRCHGQAEE
jgi:hypothetical protein